MGHLVTNVLLAEMETIAVPLLRLDERMLRLPAPLPSDRRRAVAALVQGTCQDVLGFRPIPGSAIPAST